MICVICQKRKAKRSCPAKGAQICPQCCGAEREVSLICPFDCRFLEESRTRERGEGLDPKNFPYKDIRIEEQFLVQNSDLLATVAVACYDGTMEIAGGADRDLREALDALIQTSKTLKSGIYYESQPESAFARRVSRHIHEAIEEFREKQTKREGLTRTRDRDALGVLVFLYRMALDRDNGRPRGRAFLDFLRRHFAQERPAAPNSLILPGA